MKKTKNNEKEKKVIAKGSNFPISTKHAVAICRFIKGKKPIEAILLLEDVQKKKIAIPMKGEIPHRHNMPKGQPEGRYPIKAAKYFVKLLKNLNANASVKGIINEDLKIKTAKADKASRPTRGTRIAYGRKKAKRTHVTLEAVEIENKKMKKAEEENKEPADKKEIKDNKK